MKIVTSKEEAASTPGHVVLAQDLGWPDKQAYYKGLWDLLNTPGHAQYVGNITGPDQEIINTAAVHTMRSWGYYEDSLVGLKSVLANLKAISDSPQYWLSTTTQRAIWAATGPSLLNHLDDIRSAKEMGYLIVCPDASLHHLVRNGIKPHMVFTTERGPETIKLFEMAEEACDDLSGIIVNMGIYTDISVYRFAKEHSMLPTYHFRQQSEVFYLFPEIQNAVENKNVQWPTPHVAAPSWSWMFNRGIKELILVGQDLAYGDNGATHAPNSHKDDWLPTLDRIACKSNDGSDITTNSYWAEWALDLSNMLEKKWKNKVQVINTASKGLPIRGTFYATSSLKFNLGPAPAFITTPGIKHRKLKEALHELKRYNPECLGLKSIDEFYKTVPVMLFLGFPLTVNDYCRWQMERYKNGGKHNVKILQGVFRKAKNDIRELITEAIKND